ncbi:5-methyltetrahydropteroyltriglutamate--homocysteine methyltransferase [Candidatus Tremblaya princeps]|uniref:5-methyltetrahydropteroyltriglutamate--homocysteine S-methyltransferase n=1 Tax=Tremblaya princeps TaxID=189385 RepID=A0A143WNH8_TREPR|nr:5-methyltetrahydropteroyltriglutamate--homocysteine methyltransferase [Candidatus Tremblaya princeps]
MITSHILGFPKMGRARELKFALERYWACGSYDNARLLHEARGDVCREGWDIQRAAGMDYVTVGDFALYDHVLSTLALMGCMPGRLRMPAYDKLCAYFTAARGGGGHAAMDMKKWFNTNYHYMVPEYESGMEFDPGDGGWLAEEVDMAQAAGHRVKASLLGPVSLLWLGREHGGLVNRLELLPGLVDAYAHILTLMRARGIEWVQVEEPIACLNVPDLWMGAMHAAYDVLSRKSPRLLLTSYYSFPTGCFDLLCQLPVSGLHVDMTRSFRLGALRNFPQDMVLSAGAVDGRHVWSCDLAATARLLERVRETARLGDRMWVSTSCSLMHIPVDASMEAAVSRSVRPSLSFALQKAGEVAALQRSLTHGMACLTPARPIYKPAFKPSVGFGTEDLLLMPRRHPGFADRAGCQRESLCLPLLPTTTVGSFPQTPRLRQLRLRLRQGSIRLAAYMDAIRLEIEHIVRRQAELGMDVLVHGEVERGDMVEYFGESMDGFVITRHGWVQSYGSRCAKPPIIARDVSFVRPMTLYWTSYARRLTSLPMKGMITGPTTIVCWSFARRDQSYQEVSLQVSRALRIEVSLLCACGVGIIQIDEPALREGLPLLHSMRRRYLAWAADAFGVASSSASPCVQIHTHICYSELGDVLQTMSDMDADVVSVESARSNMSPLALLRGFRKGVGPGVFDVHSPQQPSLEAMVGRIIAALGVIPKENVWVNPDCGLKTRTWEQVNAALSGMIAAAAEVRRRLHVGEQWLSASVR